MIAFFVRQPGGERQFVVIRGQHSIRRYPVTAAFVPVVTVAAFALLQLTRLLP